MHCSLIGSYDSRIALSVIIIFRVTIGVLLYFSTRPKPNITNRTKI